MQAMGLPSLFSSAPSNPAADWPFVSQAWSLMEAPYLASFPGSHCCESSQCGTYPGTAAALGHASEPSILPGESEGSFGGLLSLRPDMSQAETQDLMSL